MKTWLPKTSIGQVSLGFAIGAALAAGAHYAGTALAGTVTPTELRLMQTVQNQVSQNGGRWPVKVAEDPAGARQVRRGVRAVVSERVEGPDLTSCIYVGPTSARFSCTLVTKAGNAKLGISARVSRRGAVSMYIVTVDGWDL